MSTRTVVLWFVLITMAAVTIPADAAEMALVPVSASGPHTIVGNEIILHGAGQIVTLEIRVSDWGPVRLRAYQAVIDSSSYVSGSSGALNAVGWVGLATSPPYYCTPDGGCAPGHSCWFYSFNVYEGFCALPAHDPETGVAVDTFREDFVFRYAASSAGSVDLGTRDYRYAAVVIHMNVTPEYVPPPKYIGTLMLEVPADAAGTFTVELANGGDRTLLYDDANELIPDVTLIPALITVNPVECGNGICDSGEDASVCPEDCLPPPIPAASTWGLAVLGLLIATLAKVYYSRTRVHAC